MMPSWRSLLFVPGNNPARIAKAAGVDADAVIVDLEDAVAADQKPAARSGLADAAALLASAGRPALVRINSRWTDIAADLAVSVRENMAGIMVPKVRAAGRLSTASEMIAELSEDRGLARIPTIIALIEDSEGLARMHEIAAVEHVAGLALGTEDFSLAMGVPPSPERLDLPCRQMALAAARQGIRAFAMPISIATIDDQDAWSAAAAKARAMGISGALCIHPKQVPIVNQTFAPSDEELSFAQGAIAAWGQAGGKGVIQHGARMIDLPVILAAERLLNGRAGAAGS